MLLFPNKISYVDVSKTKIRKFKELDLAEEKANTALLGKVLASLNKKYCSKVKQETLN